MAIQGKPRTWDLRSVGTLYPVHDAVSQSCHNLNMNDKEKDLYCNTLNYVLLCVIVKRLINVNLPELYALHSPNVQFISFHLHFMYNLCQGFWHFPLDMLVHMLRIKTGVGLFMDIFSNFIKGIFSCT